MVYCPECGTKNEEDAKHCTNCGADLYYMKKRRKREEPCLGRKESPDEECFGIPYVGAIIGIIFGILIILIGLAIAIGLAIWRWIGPLIVILIGLFIIIAVILGYRRR